MIYTAKYLFGGRGRPPMNYLEPGDVVELKNSKIKEFKVKKVFLHKGEIVYETDSLGLVYARELERLK